MCVTSKYRAGSSPRDLLDIVSKPKNRYTQSKKEKNGTETKDKWKKGARKERVKEAEIKKKQKSLWLDKNNKQKKFLIQGFTAWRDVA